MNNLVILMGGGTAGGNPITQIVPLVLIVVVFYFFMIRPQMKKAKDTKKYIEALKVNDKILTIGGIYGTISKMNEDGTMIIAVEDGSKMKISKNAVSQDATSTLNQTT
ncbi:MAG: preprotein translocase subunit YajC [Burkholderiales bacterium]|nr:preprotein translocase subunit YajC [Bacteroidia bacterium]